MQAIPRFLNIIVSELVKNGMPSIVYAAYIIKNFGIKVIAALPYLKEFFGELWCIELQIHVELGLG